MNDVNGVNEEARMVADQPSPRRAALVWSAVVATTTLLPSVVAAQTPELPYGFHVGEPFPTLAFPALETGEPTSIADFRGQRLILHVFASW